MVANANSLFIGTSASTAVVQLDKTKFTSHTIGHGHLHGITANEDGYVIVTFGGRNPVERTFGPDGEEMGLGGIAAPPTLPNQTIGVPLN
jgi:hypothetical protein